MSDYRHELNIRIKRLAERPSPLAIPTHADNAVEILSVSLRASTVICEAPPHNCLKPIIGIAGLICETAKTAKSNRDTAEELAKHAIDVTSCVVDRALKNGIVQGTNEDAQNILKSALEDVHSHLIFLRKRRRAMSWMLAAQEKDRFAQLNAGLDRALSFFTLDTVASTLEQLDGEMSQNFAALRLQRTRSAGSEKTAWAVPLAHAVFLLDPDALHSEGP
ncbi:hypothetical protein C8J57DRAFT_1723772 [Mycena rebaudengoi]|nr:hypothetical protein C8J57DRAFT_1723772 [Mycena rebaudengoi]